MNQYGQQAKKKIVLHFEPSDATLLKRLIDETPGVQNVNGDPFILNTLWRRIADEYNKYAFEKKSTSTLRRKYKSIREIAKKRLKLVDKFGPIDKRPRLDSPNDNRRLSEKSADIGHRQLSERSTDIGQLTSLISNSVNYFPECESLEMDSNVSGSGNYRNNMDFGNTFFEPSKQNTYGAGISRRSPPPFRNTFSSSYQSSSNITERQTSLKRSYHDDDSDALLQDDVDNRSHYEEDFPENTEKNDVSQPASLPSDTDHQLAKLQRVKLNTDISCRRKEHEMLMLRICKYHDIKMFEVKTSMQLQRSKHALEMQYLRMKVRQCREALEKDSFVSPSQVTQSSRRSVERRGVVDLTCEGIGNMSKDVAEMAGRFLPENAEIDEARGSNFVQTD